MCNQSSKNNFAALCLIIVSSIATRNSVAIAGEVLRNDDREFSFNIPDGWMKGVPRGADENAAASIYFPNTSFQEGLQVFVRDLPDAGEFDFVTDSFPLRQQEELKKEVPDAQFKKPERTEVAGYPTWTYQAEVNKSGSIYRTKFWLVMYRRHVYSILWTDSPEKSHPKDVEAIIASFTFTSDFMQGEEVESSVLQFGFTIPKGWVKATRKEAGRASISIYIPSTSVKERVTVDVMPASPSIRKQFASDRYLSLMRDSLRAINPKSNVVSGERTKIADQSAWMYRTEEKMKEGISHSTIWQVINNEWFYTITWRHPTDTTRTKQVDGLVQSFHFLTDN